MKLDPAREFMIEMSRLCLEERFEGGALGGRAQRFVGCPTHRSEDPEERCYSCEAYELLEARERKDPTYKPDERPMTVWYRNDASLLAWAIPFYLRTKPKAIVDVTYGQGRFWRNSKYLDILTKIDEKHPLDSSVLAYPFYATLLAGTSMDVVVFDPPHISEANTPNASKLVSGKMNFESVEHSADVTALFPPFMREAYRITRPGGIVLCKIADQVHRGRACWQHVDMMLDAKTAGFTVCDLLIKVRPSAVNGNWKSILHARKIHVFWIVLRKKGDGQRC